MLTPEPVGSATGEMVLGRTQEEKYADEAWIKAIKAHKRAVVDRHLDALQENWGVAAMGVPIHARARCGY